MHTDHSPPTSYGNFTITDDMFVLFHFNATYIRVTRYSGLALSIRRPSVHHTSKPMSQKLKCVFSH